MGAFKTLPFFLLTFGSMCSIAAVSGTQQNLKLFLSLDRHYTQSDAARVLSLVLSFSIAGRLLMGWLADRLSKKYVMLLTYLLVAAGIPLLFMGHTRATLYASAAVFGIGLGGDYMIIPLMTAEIFGMQIFGRLLGVILTAGGVAEAVSPWLTGRLRDTTGNYSESCFVLVGIALLGAAAVLGLPGRERNDLMSTQPILRLGTVKTVAGFQQHLQSLGLIIPCDDTLLKGDRIPVAPAPGQWRHQDRQPDRGASHGRLGRHGRWQSVRDTIRRWQRFGRSGAKLIWGGEAVAVSHEGRANPNQLVAAAHTERGWLLCVDVGRRASSYYRLRRRPADRFTADAFGPLQPS